MIRIIKIALASASLCAAGRAAFAADAVAGNGVAKTAAFFAQTTVVAALFDHVFLDSNECLHCPQAPWQFQHSKTGLWAKGYAGTDKLDLDGGLPKVSGDFYGGIVGADFKSMSIGGNWRYLPSLYAAYNGGRQRFGGVDATQSGGQVGVISSWSDGGLMGAVLAYGGFYNNDIKADVGADSVNNWHAGAAVKLVYDWRLASRNAVIQPGVSAAWNYFGSQKWNSDISGAPAESGFLKGLNLAPGLAFIAGAETFNIHISGAYVMNFANDVAGKTDGTESPKLEVPGEYFEYGLGAVGKLGASTLLDAKMTLRSGEYINGISGRAGIAYKF